jgi:alpha-tubulin suppressor-like RCC1 family protein
MLALERTGRLMAWGSNNDGATSVPAEIRDIRSFSAGSDHSLAANKGGQVFAWGMNNSGQRNVPAGLKDVTMVSGG